jgi:hypothetical protein
VALIVLLLLLVGSAPVVAQTSIYPTAPIYALAPVSDCDGPNQVVTYDVTGNRLGCVTLDLGGLGGAAAWGSITGTLSAQTDLQTALDGKAATSHTHAISHVTSLQTTLDGKATADHAHSGLAPSGGTTGQVLKKASNTDYDYTWQADATGAGGSPAWGDVTGTLSNQTDLQSALDGKAATAHSHVDADIPNSITIDAAAALASNPTDCTANQFATAIAASGNLTCAALGDADVPDSVTLTNLTQITSRAISDTTGTLAVSRGGTNLTASADDAVMVGNATTWESKALPDCDTAGTSKLLYDTATNAFSCGTDQTGGSGSAAHLGNSNTAAITANAADTYLTGVSVGGRLKAGTVLRWTLYATKTAAGIAAPVFSVRFGTNGTTADTARNTFTGTVQTAATDTGWFQIECNVRTHSATGVTQCVLNMMHANTTTGFTNNAQPRLFASTSAAFDTTAATLTAGLSVNPGASGVWTIVLVDVEAFNLQ